MRVVMSRTAGPGPGTVRVGRFIGRLGVVSLPAVEVGLDLDERVVRRHVAKLEAAGWLARAAWVWGEGSVAWLTGARHREPGLGGVRAVKAPPAPTTIAHGVLVGWSAARTSGAAACGNRRVSSRSSRERWEVTMRCERGYTEQLPDLAVWVKHSGPPIAVIAESGGRREDRQKKILEGWRDAIYAGRYSAVRYDCANDSVAHWISRLANKVGLTDSAFTAVVQTTASKSPRSPPPPRTTNRPSTRRRRRLNPNRRPAGSRMHPCKRPYRRKRRTSHGPSHRRHRSPRRPRPRPTASGATARSSAWTRSPAADGTVDADQV